MGEGLLSLYRTKIKREYKIAFFATLITALLIHIYKFTNTLPNHDSLWNYYSNQNMTISGRWFLQWLCGISSYYDLPWINGLLSCIYIALTNCIIVAIFQLQNPFIIWLSGALLAASPATTETFFFEFTADGYFLAMLMAAMAVYLSRIEDKKRWHQVLAIILLVLSLGTYQAYISFALILAICYFLEALLENRFNKNDYFKWVVRQILTYSFSFLLYYIIWKIILKTTHTVATSYQGIATASLSYKNFVFGIKNALRSFSFYIFQWNIIEHGFTLYNILNILFLLALAAGGLYAIKKSNIVKRHYQFIFMIFCLLAILPFAYIFCFVSGETSYGLRMEESLTVLFIFELVIYEKWIRYNKIKNIIGILLTLTVYNNSIMANISYFYLNLSYERSYSDSVLILNQINSIQNINKCKKLVVLGDRIIKVAKEDDPVTGKSVTSGEMFIFKSTLDKSLLLNQEHTLDFLNATYGLDLHEVTKTEKNYLIKSVEAEKMPCWPEQGSIKVVDDIIVIKFGEEYS